MENNITMVKNTMLFGSGDEQNWARYRKCKHCQKRWQYLSAFGMSVWKGRIKKPCTDLLKIKN